MSDVQDTLNMEVILVDRIKELLEYLKTTYPGVGVFELIFALKEIFNDIREHKKTVQVKKFIQGSAINEVFQM